jgi:hypothetical protein
MLTVRTKQAIFLAAAIIGLGALGFALQRFNIFTPNASGVTPDLITVSSITDTAATITWRTAGAETLTNLHWGETTSLGNVEIDARDRRDKATLPRGTHIVQVTGLKPNTTYHYRIVSVGNTYPEATETPLTFKTFSQSSTTQSAAVTLYGDMNSQDTDIIVLAYVSGSNGYSDTIPLATFLNADGTWYLNLSEAKRNDGSLIKPKDDTEVALLAIGGANNTGFIGTISSIDNPYSIEIGGALTQSAIDQVLLTSAPTTTNTPTPTPTTSSTVTAIPTSGSRQDVPLRPIGATGTPSLAPGATISREQLFASFVAPSVSNITDSSLSILFLSSSPVTSVLNWGTSTAALTNTRLDDQDSISASSRHLHHYTLTGLSAQTQYFFKSTVESTIRTFTTPLKIAAPTGQTIITGTLSNANGECIVRTQIKRDTLYSSPITTLPNASKAWAINIMPVRVSSLESYMIPIATDTVQTSAFCITSTGSAYYQTDSTTVQKAVTSGISLALTKLQ